LYQSSVQLFFFDIVTRCCQVNDIQAVQAICGIIPSHSDHDLVARHCQEKTGKNSRWRWPALEENIRTARRLHGGITPNYLPGQRNGRIRRNTGAQDLLQRYVNKGGLADVHLQDSRDKVITDAKKQVYDPQEAQTVCYLRDKERAGIRPEF